MAGILSILSIVIVGVGIFLGFSALGDGQSALEIVTLTTVGIVGVLSFFRHFAFHRSDARRLGWETDRPDWMFEVGFANLAFGFMGLFSVLADMGTTAQTVVLLGYAIYLFQAAMLHLYRYVTDEKKSQSRLWRSVILTLLYVGMMIFFAVNAIT